MAQHTSEGRESHYSHITCFSTLYVWRERVTLQSHHLLLNTLLTSLASQHSTSGGRESHYSHITCFSTLYIWSETVTLQSHHLLLNTLRLEGESHITVTSLASRHSTSGGRESHYSHITCFSTLYIWSETVTLQSHHLLLDTLRLEGESHITVTSLASRHSTSGVRQSHYSHITCFSTLYVWRERVTLQSHHLLLDTLHLE
ncbi:hypothetical protein Pmani_034358 [Petrolisthes manimaculis]|uniref:Uncharacterized protein n=1 Tax=Petrolisthes manimaculis TaxID=1843537 RepID=A0AAE1NPI5_9EUCA|nr:hypothetical protein Pmani_034358 [Petrolisthes manimaculis]